MRKMSSELSQQPGTEEERGKEAGNGGEHPYYVVSLGRDCLDAVRIPDDQVGVGAHGDAPLPRVQVEDFGCICAGHSHKLVLIHLASHLRGHHRALTA